MSKDLLVVATGLFERVLKSAQLHSGPASDPPPRIEPADESELFLEHVDRAVEAFSTSASADIAFIAKLEMQSLARELEAVTPSWDGWKIIEICERVRRHIVKATTALRRTLGQEMESRLPGDEIYVTELVRSIQVRRRLALFRRRVIRTGETHGHALTQRLRLVGTNIAMLIGRAEYRDFRIGDRILIRDIQRTILDYLRNPLRSAEQGERIWQDVLGTMEISRQVNHRPELLEHDHLVLEHLTHELRGITSAQALERIVEQAQPVVGRDDALDDLIMAGTPLDWRRWLSAIEAALQILQQHKAPDSATEEIREASTRSGVWIAV
ncbi:MAG: hypothetical protein AAGF11_30830 [Myxococcota bacterium]